MMYISQYRNTFNMTHQYILEAYIVPSLVCKHNYLAMSIKLILPLYVHS